MEVRFYCANAPSATVPDSLALYLIQADGSARPLQKRFKLPDMVEISRSTTLSSLLSNTFGGPASIKSGDSTLSQSFRYLPNGTTNLTASTSPTLTLMLRSDDRGDTLPPNFITLQIDLQTGRVQTFQP